MICLPEEKNFKEIIKQHEIEELKEFCEDQGFTPEQTKAFIERSMKKRYDDESTDE